MESQTEGGPLVRANASFYHHEAEQQEGLTGQWSEGVKPGSWGSPKPVREARVGPFPGAGGNLLLVKTEMRVGL